MSERAPAAAADAAHMQRALTLAEHGWGMTAPNPMVGAVVVANGEVVGEGYHARYGEAHAEVMALGAAGVRARGATLYVTLEPCTHFGKTPPCVDAIISARVARVVIAALDPSHVARGGVNTLRSAGIDVDVGVEQDRAIELDAPFFNAHVTTRPWVTLKLALSADGGIADPSGVHRWITGRASREHVHHLRANSDAIAVGIGTVLSDDPSLTVRDVVAPRVEPRRVVFDSNLRTPLASILVRTAREIPTAIFAKSDASRDRADRLEDAGVRVFCVSSIEEALEELRQRDVRSLFVEGGARIAGALVAKDLVDRLIIFRSPLQLGAGALHAFDFAPPGFERSLAERRVVETRRFGDDVMTTYALHELSIPCSPD